MKLGFSFFGRRQQPLSKERYWTLNILLWLYTIIWISILLFVWYSWNVSILYKFGVNFILILGTPALSDLLMSYDKYRKEWETKFKV